MTIRFVFEMRIVLEFVASLSSIFNGHMCQMLLFALIAPRFLRSIRRAEFLVRSALAQTSWLRLRAGIYREGPNRDKAVNSQDREA